jgi:hypothetical protein
LLADWPEPPVPAGGSPHELVGAVMSLVISGAILYALARFFLWLVGLIGYFPPR